MEWYLCCNAEINTGIVVIMRRLIYLHMKYICMFLFLLCSLSLFSQESERIREGTEALESNRAIRKVRPLFLGGSFEYLFPIGLEAVLAQSSNSRDSISVDSQTVPFSLEHISSIVNTSFVVGTDLPYIFGITIPISMDIYARVGGSFVNAGAKYSNSKESFEYRSIDMSGDANVRFIFTLHQYTNIGMYLSSGIGITYPIFRGYGYFQDSTQVFLEKSDYSNIIDDSDARLTSPSYYTSISTGMVFDKISARDIKIIFGYTMKFFLSEEINDVKQIIFNRGEITSIGIKGYSIQHGVQLECVYTLP